MAGNNNISIHKGGKEGEKRIVRLPEIAIKKPEKIAPPVEKEAISESLSEHIEKKAMEEDLEANGRGREAVKAIPKGFISRQDKRRIKKIEGVLSEGLEDIYVKMNSDKQHEFRRAGELTARKINGLIEKGKTKVKKVIALIKRWLSLIPGVNKFFLEQEAKIKADEIMKIGK